MSHPPTSHSHDLSRLRDEGYEVEVYNAYLLIHNVPYVNARKEVVYGTLVSTLELAGNLTVKPSDHVAKWVGEQPCDSTGTPLPNLVAQPNLQEKIREGLVATCSFSHKPQGGYADYHQKMTRYIQILEGHAHAVDANATSKTFPVVPLTEEESVFCYLDSASSRAGIATINEKLKADKIAIVGLGGTGAYILDLIVKIPVGEIHLFDGDWFLQHNAFRCPGAPSVDDLARKPKKVDWFAKTYSRMRRKIIAHSQFVNETNVAELKPMDFVFLCIDKGAPRQTIVTYLVKHKIPFVDVGMGLYIENEALAGSARVTTCTPTFHDHVTKRIPFMDSEDDEYSSNIQIADMNALNAALAVIKWKKLRGFYIDLENEHTTVYGISTNLVTNEDVSK